MTYGDRRLDDLDHAIEELLRQHPGSGASVEIPAEWTGLAGFDDLDDKWDRHGVEIWPTDLEDEIRATLIPVVYVLPEIQPPVP